MNTDQKSRLERARSTLYQVLVEEVESPMPTLKTKEGRGDRVWMKKNAIATANLIMRVEHLLGLRGAGSWGGGKEDDPDQPGAEESATASSDPSKIIAAAEQKVALRLVGGDGKG